MSGLVNLPASDQDPVDAVTLPCGADVDLLLEQAAEGRGTDLDVHQQHCVHCQAALGEFTARWAPVAELAQAPVPPPRGLTASVMNQVRRLARDTWYTLETAQAGVVRIAARVVAALARDSAQLVPGVRIALGRSTQGKPAALAAKATFEHQNPHAAVGVLGRTAVVDLAVAVSYGDPAHQIARQIQRQVTATLRDTTGLRDVTVNVTVDDLIDDEG